jgi:hypothetical protein
MISYFAVVMAVVLLTASELINPLYTNIGLVINKSNLRNAGIAFSIVSMIIVALKLYRTFITL